MSRASTQTERLIAAARGYRGVSRIDFQLPDVIDGGDPILNFPGRMWDAERKGFCFEVIGKRNRCKIFRLASEPGQNDLIISSSEVEVSSGVDSPRPRVGLSPELTDLTPSEDKACQSEQGSLFAGIERRKGQHGFHDQEDCAA